MTLFEDEGKTNWFLDCSIVEKTSQDDNLFEAFFLEDQSEQKISMISHGDEEVEEGETGGRKLTETYDQKPIATLGTLWEEEVGHPGVNSQV